MDQELKKIIGRLKKKDRLSRSGTVQEKQPKQPDIESTFNKYGDSISIEDYLQQQGWKRNAAMEGKTFDNFVADTPAAQARLDCAKNFKAEKNLFMFGAPGRGKTHLARGISKEWLKDGKELIYWPLMQLLDHLKGMMGQTGKSPGIFIEYLCNYPGLLIIDEFGRSKGGDWDRDDVIYPLVDRRQNLPTIYISNYDTVQLNNIYDSAIVSRLQTCQVVSFPENKMEDWRLKR